MRLLSPMHLLAVAFLATPAMPSVAQDVTIYRCVAADGRLALRDSPCAKNENQQVRSMARPRDPVPGVAPEKPIATPTPVPPKREVQIVYRTPARPMYECVTGDGKRYTSDNGDGNPRAVPLWTFGYPAWSHRNGGGRHGNHPSQGRPDGGNRPLHPGVAVPVGSTWVRDECHALPQQEICSRLSDRRYEIIRRYNSALQSERRQLELEQRGIDARIDNDCGTP